MADTIKITSPIGKKTASSLRVGDFVGITGTLITARDRAHRFLLAVPGGSKVPAELKKQLSGSLIYHCGPIVRKKGGNFSVISAGPTTSARLNIYAANLAEKYGIGAFMGKGGMSRLPVPYLSAIGGAGALLARHIKKVRAVYLLEKFGMAEAIWVFDVEEFPAIVTADCMGNSLHNDILKESMEML